MLGVTLYDLVKSFHILTAITWVGGAIALQILAIRIVRGNDPQKLRAFAGDAEWIGTRVFTPASALVLLLGIWMVILEPVWTFGQFWILAALAMFGYSFLSGALYLGPKTARLKKLFEEEGTGSPAALALVRKLFVFSRIELVFLILIVFDMVIKPGL